MGQPSSKSVLREKEEEWLTHQSVGFCPSPSVSCPTHVALCAELSSSPLRLQGGDGAHVNATGNFCVVSVVMSFGGGTLSGKNYVSLSSKNE